MLLVLILLTLIEKSLLVNLEDLISSKKNFQRLAAKPTKKQKSKAKEEVMNKGYNKKIFDSDIQNNRSCSLSKLINEQEALGEETPNSFVVATMKSSKYERGKSFLEMNSESYSGMYHER